MAAQSECRFIDPDAYGSAEVYDLLNAAARGHAGIDQRFIRAIVDRGREAIPGLMRFALEDRADDPVNLEEDLISIFRYLRSPEALPFFIRYIRDNPEDLSDEVVDSVVPYGRQALEPLLALYEELGEEQGEDVAFLLAALGIRDRRILTILTERLEYNAGDAALALSVYRDPEAKPALEAMRSQIPEEEVSLDREFAIAIEACDQPRADPPAEVEPEPFDIWDLYPEKATPPVEVLSAGELLQMLASTSPEHRAEAARAFRNRSEYPAEVRDRLLEITRADQAAEVRSCAWEALGERSNEPLIRDALKQALADESRSTLERTGALVGLAALSDDPEVAAQIRAFYERPETRARAMEAMWRSFDRQFAEVFPPHLDDADPECRRAAIWGAGYLGGPALAGKLRSMFEDDEFRSDALFAYSLVVPSTISHSRVPGLFRKINEAAGGLTYGEAELVQTALDQRLAMRGLDPYFAAAEGAPEHWDEEASPAEEQSPPSQAASKAGRNDPCPCGSGMKYKKCHGA